MSSSKNTPKSCLKNSSKKGDEMPTFNNQVTTSDAAVKVTNPNAISMSDPQFLMAMALNEGIILPQRSSVYGGNSSN
jgi:hypothetical protein